MLFTLLGLFALLGIIFGWVAFFRTGSLLHQIHRLQQEVKQLRASLQSGAMPGQSESGLARGTVQAPEAAQSAPEPVPESISPNQSSEAPALLQPSPVSRTVQTASSRTKSLPENNSTDWIYALRNSWMIWLGGTCIGLAGIFLVRYSIDQGYLGPGARISGALVLGLALHAAAEWLRRSRETHKAFAALAAGGSITLYAALLAALHLYALMSPWVVFSGLSLVALATMALAFLHGPVLAVIGILGAYLVPILIGSDTGNALSASIYALIISACALLLMRFVYRPWLWAGMLIGSFCWWILTHAETGMEVMNALYLLILAYLMISLPAADYLMRLGRNISTSAGGMLRLFTAEAEVEKLLPYSLLLVVLFNLFSILTDGFNSFSIVKYSPLCLLMLLVGSKREYLRLLPWILLLSLGAGWLLSRLSSGNIVPFATNEVTAFYWYCLLSVLIFSGASLYIYFNITSHAIWMSLAALPPVLFLALAYLLSSDRSPSLQWGLLAAILASFYFLLIRLDRKVHMDRITVVWLFISGHFAYSLAVAMLLREASMTLALAAQIISLSWVIRRYQLKELGWILKGVLAAIVFRLTLNPWLQQYPTDIHWSLWTYGGSTLCCLCGALLLKGREELEQWTWVAVLHLFALTLWAETRYWLYDGSVYTSEYTFREAAINLCLFGTLGLVYHYRMKTSAVLAPIYGTYSAILIVFALGNDAMILAATLLSTSWSASSISTTPLFNFMLVAYGFPVLLGYLYYHFYKPSWRSTAALFTAASAFIFSTLQVRHLWQGTISLQQNASDGELYSYSALWLAIAVACILGGIWRYGNRTYNGGMLLLALVIAKLFLVDMSDLEGLLRVASFMGMGLGLLGIAYLHQKLQGGHTRTDPANKGASE